MKSVNLEGKKIKMPNREVLAYLSEVVGCYYCLNTMTPPQITEFTGDGDPLCPNCGVDSIVRTADADKLKKLSEKYFSLMRKTRKEIICPKCKSGNGISRFECINKAWMGINLGWTKFKSKDKTITICSLCQYTSEDCDEWIKD